MSWKFLIIDRYFSFLKTCSIYFERYRLLLIGYQ